MSHSSRSSPQATGEHAARKDALRRAVWDRLEREGVARFPYPPHGRIPNFAGAAEAAARLFELPVLARARRIKVNPDAPQRPLRIEALRRGIEVYVATPRLRGGFRCFDPQHIPEEALREAASLSRGARWAREVALEALPPLDAIVVGSVAVSRDGGRCGKGEGYADLEYGILRALGHAPVPVLTSVHPLQIVDSLPSEPLDLPLHVIATPEARFEVESPRPGPDGIDWDRLGEADLAAMPILRALRGRGTG